MFNKNLAKLFVWALIATVFMFANVAFSHIVEEGLVSYWSFEEDTVTDETIEDAIGNNDGTINGEFETVEGKIGQGLRNKSLTDYVQIASDALSGETTITVWAMAEEYTATHYVFGHTTLPTWKDRVQIYSDDQDGQLDLGLGDSHTRHTNIALLEIGEWYHISLVYNDTPDGDYEVYVDGELKAEGSFTGINELMGFADISNDGAQTGRDEGWLGVIDEFCLYDRVLSKAEVNQNMMAEGMAVINPAGKLATVWGRIKK